MQVSIKFMYAHSVTQCYTDREQYKKYLFLPQDGNMKDLLMTAHALLSMNHSENVKG